MGIEAVVVPLFEVVAVDWTAPDPAKYDSILLTSAHAARHGGGQLALFTHLRCYAVGESTAAAANASGFSEVRIGPSDGAALLAIMKEEGASRPLHLCGRDHLALGSVDRLVVYASEAEERLPLKAVRALEEGAIALLHSPRSAFTFASLFDKAGLERGSTSLATISGATSAAVGEGWKRKETAREPRDKALLELAAKLCKTGASVEMGRGE